MLTEEQRKTLSNLNGALPIIVDQSTNTEYVLVLKVEYDLIADELEIDRREQRAFRKVSMKSAAKRLMEDELTRICVVECAR